MTVVAIHQPNFFPWLGYFAKAVQADRFILLDHVQFPQAGGTWMNRVKLLMGGEAKWVTAPVARGSAPQSVTGTIFASAPWRRKLIAAIDTWYRKAPHYGAVMPVLRPLIEHQDDNVARYNANAILGIAGALGIARDKFLLSSEMAPEGAATRMLVGLIRATGGSGYLCGAGSADYQEDHLFAEAGISLIYQNFVPEPYPQLAGEAFVPGLSIIDPLMNLGFEATRQMLDRAGETASGLGRAA